MGGGVHIRVGGGRGFRRGPGWRRGPGFRRGFGWRRRGWGWRRRRGVVVVGGPGYYGGGCGPGVMMVPFCIIGLIIAIAVIGALTGQLSSNSGGTAVDCTTVVGCTESASTERCWNQLSWNDLSPCEQGLWMFFTYNQAIWDDGRTPDAAIQNWVDLQPDQQTAATDLGYTESTWDASNGNTSTSATVIVLVIVAAVMCCCICICCQGDDDDDDEAKAAPAATATPAPAVAVPAGTPMMANTPGFVPINGGNYPVAAPMAQPMMAQPMMAQPAVAVPVGQPAMGY